MSLPLSSPKPVSYTHLDVYKRQLLIQSGPGECDDFEKEIRNTKFILFTFALLCSYSRFYGSLMIAPNSRTV